MSLRTHDRLAGYRALQRVTVAVRSHVDLRRVLDTLVADAGRFLDLRICSLARWNETGSTLIFCHEYRRDPDDPTAAGLYGARFSLGDDRTSLLFERLLFREHRLFIWHPQQEAIAMVAQARMGQAVAEPRAREMPDEGPPARFLAGLGSSAYMIGPVAADQGLLGLIVAARSRELPSWSEEEIEFVRTAGDIAAVAMQHAALRARLRLVSAAAAQVNARIELAGLLRRLTEAAIAVTQSTMGLAGLREGDVMVCRELWRDGKWEPIEVRFGRDQGLPGWSWANRAPCIANDAQADRRADHDRIRSFGIRSALSIPIVSRDGEVVGFFELHNKAAGAPYGEEDIHVASSLAHQAALALELR